MYLSNRRLWYNLLLYKRAGKARASNTSPTIFQGQNGLDINIWEYFHFVLKWLICYSWKESLSYLKSTKDWKIEMGLQYIYLAKLIMYYNYSEHWERTSHTTAAAAVAAAAKSFQSCPTLCDPIDGSPPGSPGPGILQARTLEWVAISFSNAWRVKSESEVAQSCPTVSDPMDCSPPGSSIHGTFQARVLEWGAIAFSNEIKYKDTANKYTSAILT